MYTIQKLASLAQVSTRTLRYYDEIDLLKPDELNASGYRLYGEKAVDRLQHILFYRELGVSLTVIKEILTDQTFDSKKALQEHRLKLLEKKAQLEVLIQTLDKTIHSKEVDETMSDQEKFAGFKKKLVEENEKLYGSEARSRYGDEAVDNSNKKLMSLSETEMDAATQLGEKVIELLVQAFAEGQPAGAIAQEACEVHKKWLMLYWTEYTKEAHAGLGDLYVSDERFTAFYDAHQPGLSAFFREALYHYTGMNLIK